MTRHTTGVASITLAAGLALGVLSPAGAAAPALSSTLSAPSMRDPAPFRWRNLAWKVDTIVVRGGAERADNAPGQLGLLMAKRASATFKLDLPRACQSLRVRVKPNGVTIDGRARTRTKLRRAGLKPKRYEPVTSELDDVVVRLPDMKGRPARGSRRFVFRVSDATPRHGTADYVLGVTFGGWCPR